MRDGQGSVVHQLDVDEDDRNMYERNPRKPKGKMHKKSSCESSVIYTLVFPIFIRFIF